jgi:hypothetical protein
MSNAKSRGKSKKLDIGEEEIRDILDLYFEYVIENLPSKSKLTKIDIGKFNKKTTFGEQETIEIQCSSISFSSNKSKSKKEFRVCDIIDFSFYKQKGFVNLYLIREILLRLDFSGKESKIEK